MNTKENENQLTYSSSQWKKKRKEILEKQSHCLCCACLGLDTPAKEVHHVLKFGKQMDIETTNKLFLDSENLIPLCKDCHTYIHRKHELVNPVFSDYLYKLKTYLCCKYPNAIWTDN